MNTILTDHSYRYWGFWSTILLSILVFVIFSVVQSIGIISYLYLSNPESVTALTDPNSSYAATQFLEHDLLNGDAIAVGEIPAAIIGVLLIIWFASMRKPLTVDEYLDLNIPSLKSMFGFLGLLVLAMVLMESVNYIWDRPTPEFMTKVYANTKNLPLFWIAVSVAAPFFEEFLFRGFLLEGMARSKIGLTGAVIITSAIWAVIHMQYGWFEIISIFFIGILLCLAKIKSKSLYVPIAMHMLMNLAASIGMELMQ